ncbi:MAG: cobyrinic acid a,c-diamide synthase, partial [Planctomycetes bacterium]|nr:cobyrinic acid a,c-diamide synthase [Planctomycetota bacterium]
MFSRIVIGGLAGDSGKTLVSLALVLVARERGRDVAAFKKGPDYIDAAWLTWASGRPARNLDTFLMGRDAVAASFERHASADGVNIIEGNRGLHDGIDADGTHSTAALARLLGAPVLLV